jgi:hypothetical protein
MKRFLAGIGLVALLAGNGANAGDLASKAPGGYGGQNQPPPVIWNWTGFYVGGTAGYGWEQLVPPPSADLQIDGVGVDDAKLDRQCRLPCDRQARAQSAHRHKRRTERKQLVELS